MDGPKTGLLAARAISTGYNHRSNRNLPVFLLKKWPRRLLLLAKLKSGSASGPGFSQIFESGSERKTQNPAGVDSGTPDQVPPLLSINYTRENVSRNSAAEQWKLSLFNGKHFPFFRCPVFPYFSCTRLTLPSTSCRGVRTQVFSSPTPVLIQEVGILILIRILFATQIWNPNPEKILLIYLTNRCATIKKFCF